MLEKSRLYFLGLPELSLLVTNCYLLLVSLKFVIFVTTLLKVVTNSIDY